MHEIAIMSLRTEITPQILIFGIVPFPILSLIIVDRLGGAAEVVFRLSVDLQPDSQCANSFMLHCGHQNHIDTFRLLLLGTKERPQTPKSSTSAQSQGIHRKQNVDLVFFGGAGGGLVGWGADCGAYRMALTRVRDARARLIRTAPQVKGKRRA